MNHLGKLQRLVVEILSENELDRMDLYQELRARLYNDKSKAETRQRIKGAINSLKKRKIIQEHFSILSL